jgi:hypothetical protein
VKNVFFSFVNHSLPIYKIYKIYVQMYIVCKCGMDGMFKEITLYDEQTKSGTENNGKLYLCIDWGVFHHHRDVIILE